MNDLRKAAEMALEALEKYEDEWLDDGRRIYVDAELDALRQALAQPEQWTPVEIGVDVTPEGTHVVGMYVLMPDVVRHVFYSQFHPAPKREWVGLTWDDMPERYAGDRSFLHGAKWAEAKLKEKST